MGGFADNGILHNKPWSRGAVLLAPLPVLGFTFNRETSLVTITKRSAMEDGGKSTVNFFGDGKRRYFDGKIKNYCITRHLGNDWKYVISNETPR